jgi:hypothetical protein
LKGAVTWAHEILPTPWRHRLPITSVACDFQWECMEISVWKIKARKKILKSEKFRKEWCWSWAVIGRKRTSYFINKQIGFCIFYPFLNNKTIDFFSSSVFLLLFWKIGLCNFW